MRKLDGLCLVVDSSIPHARLLDIVEKALRGGVDIIQLWSSGQDSADIPRLAQDLLSLADRYDAPFIINNNLQLAKEAGAHGVHFDGYDVTPTEVRQVLGMKSIVGYTLGNDLTKLQWAESVGADYISFCAVFPSSSVTQCDIVPIQSVKFAKSTTRLSVFASGGINLNNVHLVMQAGADGVAVISAILKANDPEQTARSFKEIINRYRR